MIDNYVNNDVDDVDNFIKECIGAKIEPVSNIILNDILNEELRSTFKLNICKLVNVDIYCYIYKEYCTSFDLNPQQSCEQ